MPRLEVELLASCALLVASTSFVNGLRAGVAFCCVLLASTLLFAWLRRYMVPALQPAAFVVLFTGCLTMLDLVLQAAWPDMHQRLGGFLALLLAAGLLLANTTADAPSPARMLIRNAAMACLVVLASAVSLGSLREIIGQRFLLASLAPGALIAAGLLLAARNWLATRMRRQ